MLTFFRNKKILFIQISISLALALLSHYPITEGDLFWQNRAGAEILQSGTVQKVDTWSNTISGEPWFNFQWLYTVLLHLVTNIFGYECMPSFRAILVFCLFFLLSRIASVFIKKNYFVLYVLLPLVFCLGWFRVELRPDLSSIILFSLLLYLGVRENLLKPKTFLISISLLILGANLHGGTAPLLIFLVIAMFFTQAYQQKKLSLALFLSPILIVTWFLTPIGTSIIGIIKDYFNYNSALIGNPDQQPVSPALFSLSNGATDFFLWIFLFPVILLSYRKLLLKNKKSFGNINIYTNPYFFFGMSIFFTALSFQKYRARDYQLIFMLPVATILLENWIHKLKRYSIFIYFFVFAILIQHLHIFSGYNLVGKGIEKRAFPVGSVAFLKKHAPFLKGKLYNSYNFGGYLIDQLPEYKVSSDGRELPYQNFLKEEDRAMESPQDFQNFLLHHNFTLAINVLPHLISQTSEGTVVLQADLFPKKNWAIIFVENAAVLYLRRTEENKNIIQEREYHWLYNTHGHRGKEQEAEFRRCVTESPLAIYCLLGLAEIEEKKGNFSEAAKNLKIILDNFGYNKILSEKIKRLSLR